MPPGEIPVTCPNCNHRVSLPMAAVRRDNFYCAGCGQKIPLSGIRPPTQDNETHPQFKRPKKSSRTYRR